MRPSYPSRTDPATSVHSYVATNVLDDDDATQNYDAHVRGRDVPSVLKTRIPVSTQNDTRMRDSLHSLRVEDERPACALVRGSCTSSSRFFRRRLPKFCLSSSPSDDDLRDDTWQSSGDSFEGDEYDEEDTV